MNAFEVPLIENNNSFDYCERGYRKALLNTLIHLKPKYCLELGTYLYQSSKVFAYYFEKYEPEGKLITADISEWTRDSVPPKSVFPIMVYPHTLDVEQYHGSIKIFHPNWQKKVGNTIKINGDLIHGKMEEMGIPSFDFVFLDSCHCYDGFYSDLYITVALTGKESYILIDDIHDQNNVQSEIYRNNIAPKNNFYEFAGMGLIKAGDFVL